MGRTTAIIYPSLFVYFTKIYVFMDNFESFQKSLDNHRKTKCIRGRHAI